MKYARCKIKNIAVPIPKKYQNNGTIPPEWIEESNTLPDNCIRIKDGEMWCNECRECLGRD